MSRIEEFKINNLIKACVMATIAQLLFVGELDAQGLIYSDSFENCLPGDTLVWDGGGDDISWANPANWQGNTIPANGDSVSVRMFSAQPLVYDSSLGTRSVRCLDSNRALSVTGGNLEILKAGTVSSSVTVAGGSLSVTKSRLLGKWMAK